VFLGIDSNIGGSMPGSLHINVIKITFKTTTSVRYIENSSKCLNVYKNNTKVTAGMYMASRVTKMYFFVPPVTNIPNKLLPILFSFRIEIKDFL
jgi:hypothetical protein